MEMFTSDGREKLVHLNLEFWCVEWVYPFIYHFEYRVLWWSWRLFCAVVLLEWSASILCLQTTAWGPSER